MNPRHRLGSRSARRPRAGSYAVGAVLMLTLGLTLGAFAFEVGRLSLCHSHLEVLTDHAAATGVHALRRTADLTDAERAIDTVLSRNPICRTPVTLQASTWGTWTPSAGFVAGASPPNAVQISVDASDAGGVSLLWGSFLNTSFVSLGATSTAALPPLHLAIVHDVQTVWSESQALLVRDALRDTLQHWAASAGPEDTVTLVLAASHLAWVWTEPTPVAGNAASLDASWESVILASRAGTQPSTTDGVDCTVHTGAQTDDYTTPPGGCYPDMPRRYSDEVSLDLGNALALARSRLQSPPLTHRRGTLAVLGQPYGNLPTTVGEARALDGFVEGRFAEQASSVPAGSADLQDRAETAATSGWEDLGVDLWLLPVNTLEPQYDTLPQGRGWRLDVADPGSLAPALREVVSTQPVGVVP